MCSYFSLLEICSFPPRDSRKAWTCRAQSDDTRLLQENPAGIAVGKADGPQPLFSGLTGGAQRKDFYAVLLFPDNRTQALFHFQTGRVGKAQLEDGLLHAEAVVLQNGGYPVQAFAVGNIVDGKIGFFQSDANPVCPFKAEPLPEDTSLSGAAGAQRVEDNGIPISQFLPPQKAQSGSQGCRVHIAFKNGLLRVQSLFFQKGKDFSPQSVVADIVGNKNVHGASGPVSAA